MEETNQVINTNNEKILTPPPQAKLDIPKIINTINTIQNKLNELLNELQNNGEIKQTSQTYTENNKQVIEGIFNGEVMIGPDQKIYSVPPNYASKSRLVEGDGLKLTIEENGHFIFKQIKPTERERINGVLAFDNSENQWFILYNGKPVKILTASVTFFKGKVGDTAVLVVPKNKISSWGAMENIITSSNARLPI